MNLRKSQVRDYLKHILIKIDWRSDCLNRTGIEMFTRWMESYEICIISDNILLKTLELEFIKHNRKFINIWFKIGMVEIRW